MNLNYGGGYLGKGSAQADSLATQARNQMAVDQWSPVGSKKKLYIYRGDKTLQARTGES